MIEKFRKPDKGENKKEGGDELEPINLDTLTSSGEITAADLAEIEAAERTIQELGEGAEGLLEEENSEGETETPTGMSRKEAREILNNPEAPLSKREEAALFLIEAKGESDDVLMVVNALDGVDFNKIARALMELNIGDLATHLGQFPKGSLDPSIAEKLRDEGYGDKLKGMDAIFK